MLKPGSSKLKESEAQLLSEIKDFEEQEDKTLQNMEETMRMMSSVSPILDNHADEALGRPAYFNLSPNAS